MNQLVRFVAMISVIAVAGCGGGMQAGVGSGGSGAPMSVGLGTVTGFGSLIVNGQHYDETMAEILIDERPDRATPATIAAIRLGMRVELQHQNRVISTATASAELIGPVTSVSASSFVALGQAVLVNASPTQPTVFDGFTTLGDLTANAMVEVHGERAATGEILATRVELRPSSLPLVRIAGTASNVNGRNFSIGSLAVNGAGASLVPAGATVANGDRVVVWSDVPYTSGTLNARIIRVGAAAILNNASVTIDGVVGDFQSSSDFRVKGIPVNASSAQYIGGTAASLANGRAVRVQGTVGNGVLRAATIEFLPSTQQQAQLTGLITEFVNATSAFRIRNAQVRVTPQTTYSSGTVANLGSGVVVKLSGPVVNGVVEAATLEFVQAADASQRVVFGPVAAPVSAVAADGSRTFRIDGLTAEVKVTASTSYKNGVAADIAVGRELKLKGAPQGTQFLADEVQFMDNPASPPVIEIEGTAGNVQASSVVVNGQTVQLTAATTYSVNGAAATISDLRNGAKVKISAVRVGNVVTAQSVEIEGAGGGMASVRGLVRDRTAGATQFLVGAQRVSVATDPTVIPGNKTLADIVNGSDLEVEGTLANGILNATRIKFR